MGLKQKIDNLERVLAADKTRVYVVCHVSENFSPEEIEVAKQRGISEGKQVVFMGELEEWSR